MSYSNKEILERAREELKKSEDCVFEGVRYSTLGLVPDTPRMFHKIKHVELGDSDVILNGYPRSGNHWTFEVIGAILNQDIGNEKDDFLFRLMDFMGDDVESRIHGLPAPRLINSHPWASRLPEIIRQGNVKIVYILRNPKDALASWYRLLKDFISPYGFEGTWEECFELSLTGEIPFGSWFDHVLEMEKFMKEYPDSPVHVVLYEKMKEDPVSEIKKLCDFLDRPNVDVEELALATSFAQMKKKREPIYKQSEKALGREGCHGVMVKGVIGGWREWFTVDQSERYDKAFEEKMKGSKLADMVREYI
ncbi:sulfotransferase family cytosolic 1B member 1 [Aplysia californica]|uniref:Sulfotransferase family cytosolic 1B member 1 n=1 Tax=Aplysia californica TaxID=6500 RepID=A0ABM0JNT3_APLCA|nr:sulfotransferase family cytosolic 1B member 1 [Aplysia californica]